MASQWLEADGPGLVPLASLVERVHEGDAPLGIVQEVRQLEDRFGLSPLARLRLQWEVERNPAAVSNGAKGDDARWRRASA
jgi:hypothetical protein